MVTRKYVRIVILLACGIALVLAASGCKKKVEKGIAERTGKTFVIEPMVGIGKVSFGMTVEEMKKILAEPQRTRGPVHEYRDSGFAIFTIKDNTVTMIVCGDRHRADSPLVKDCRCRTKKVSVWVQARKTS